jgi:hypothetical protein
VLRCRFVRMVWATARHRMVTMNVWATGASKQDGDAVPGAAGDPRGGHPEFSHNGAAA